MGRYLMFISYIGTHYHGLQIQHVQHQDKIKTVQGVLESILRRINPWHKTKTCTSSRTDAGVHALSNALHFDFLHKYHPDKEYDPEMLTCRLNALLRKSSEDIRVISIHRVNDDFNSRYKATARSYLYRLAVSHKPGNSDLHPVSILEKKKLLNVTQPFNTDLFLRSVEVLGGTHDFTAFTTENFLQREPHKNPIKTMTVGVKKGQGVQDVRLTEPANGEYWDLHFHSSSYLYHQVRRMVGALLQVGRGKLDLDDLRRVLDDPSHRKSIPQSAISAVAPWGLYLKEVHYDPQDLLYTPSSVPVLDSNQDVMSANVNNSEEVSENSFEQNFKDNHEMIIPFSRSADMDNSIRTDSAGKHCTDMDNITDAVNS